MSERLEIITTYVLPGAWDRSNGKGVTSQPASLWVISLHLTGWLPR